MSEYHVPVLLQESIDALDIKPNGVYVDVTFGGGGHSRKILECLGPDGMLFGFDQDDDATRNLPDDSRFHFINQNFRHIKRFLRLEGIKQVDGILADLGVSSHQFDEASRGFSYRFDAALDMRMNQQEERSAADILNRFDETKLQLMFGEYGEVRNARTLAQAIIKARAGRPLATINDLVQVCEPLTFGNRPKYLAQVFQALRIEVNDEMNALQDFFNGAKEVLGHEGRLVVISYHSLEDRMTKNFMKTGTFDGEPVKDFYGNIERPFHVISKKTIEPNEAEIKRNSRARSAKMRVAACIKNQ